MSLSACSRLLSSKDLPCVPLITKLAIRTTEFLRYSETLTIIMFSVKLKYVHIDFIQQSIHQLKQCSVFVGHSSAQKYSFTIFCGSESFVSSFSFVLDSFASFLLLILEIDSSD